MFSQSLAYSFFINIQKMESITFIETILKDVQVYDILENKLYKICPIPRANSLSFFKNDESYSEWKKIKSVCFKIFKWMYCSLSFLIGRNFQMIEETI